MLPDRFDLSKGSNQAKLEAVEALALLARSCVVGAPPDRERLVGDREVHPQGRAELS
jgi:hypothetical protein